MTGPTELGRMLHEEHLRTLELMNAIEMRISGKQQNRRLDTADADDERLLRDVLAIVDQEINRHFRFEEDVLFPVLDTAGAGDMTRLLIQEHAGIRPLAETLRTLSATVLENGCDDDTWRKFRYAAMDLVHAVMFHIQKEEMGLIQKLGFFTDRDTDKSLSARYAEYRP